MKSGPRMPELHCPCELSDERICGFGPFGREKPVMLHDMLLCTS
ncbi:hypothetical protein [Paenibacillus sp. SAFN-054]